MPTVKSPTKRPAQAHATKAPARTAAAAAAVVAKPADPPAAIAEQSVVRDGFTMPQQDYDTLKTLKATCLKCGVEVKKSELLRAGVQALAALQTDALIARMRALPAVKAGRKKKKS